MPNMSAIGHVLPKIWRGHVNMGSYGKYPKDCLDSADILYYDY
jgi:hypothetical protein